jgi:branched-chain amino acid transport system ATP-binding protein
LVISSAESADSQPVRHPLLSVANMTATFGGTRALDGVTFDIEPGEIVSVIGPNGAGKSTLLNAIGGLLRNFTSGQVTLSGRDISRLAPSEIARAGLSRSFQDPKLVGTDSVLQNVMGGGHVRLEYGMLDQLWRRRRVARAERELLEQANTILELTGISNVATTSAAALPYGARKLVDIARAVVASPRLLLLDEPTSGIDSAEQRTVETLLRGMQVATGVTMLVVEHHMSVVRAISDRVIALQAGSVLMSGSPSQVLDSAEFRDAAIGAAIDKPVGRQGGHVCDGVKAAERAS